jgi:hypothetical protein
MARARLTGSPVSFGMLAAASAVSRSNSWIDAACSTTATAGTGSADARAQAVFANSSTAVNAVSSVPRAILQRIDGSGPQLNPLGVNPTDPVPG